MVRRRVFQSSCLGLSVLFLGLMALASSVWASGGAGGETPWGLSSAPVFIGKFVIEAPEDEGDNNFLVTLTGACSPEEGEKSEFKNITFFKDVPFFYLPPGNVGLFEDFSGPAMMKIFDRRMFQVDEERALQENFHVCLQESFPGDDTFWFVMHPYKLLIKTDRLFMAEVFVLNWHRQDEF